MVADSPYQVEDLALPLPAAAAAGAAGALVMLAVVTIWVPVAGFLQEAARIILPDRWVVDGSPGVWLGVVVQAAVGVILGLLYASSQRRAPIIVLVATGIVFGIMIWIAARVLTLLTSADDVRTLVHSWFWLLACLAYGEVLAVTAILWQRLAPSGSATAPKD